MARQASSELVSVEGNRDTRLPTPEPTGASLSIRDYYGILIKRRLPVLLFFAIVVAGTAAWLLREPDVFRATASLEINPSGPRYLGSQVQDVAETSGGFYWQSKEYFETQYQIIKSRAVAQKVSDRLGLAADLKFLRLDKLQNPEERARKLAAADPVAILQALLRVEPVKDSRIVRLSIEDTDRERASRIANAYTEAYVEYTLERKLEVSRAASTWLGAQLDDLKHKLESSENVLYNFKRENDVLTASFEDKQSISSQRLIALEEALTEARTRRAALEARRVTVENAKKAAAADPAALESLPGVSDSAVVSALRQRLLALLEERKELESRYLEQHPKRLALEEKLTEVRVALDRQVRTLVTAAETQYREAADTEQNLRQLIEGAKREAFEVNKREIDYKRLKREQENNQRLHDLVLQRLKESDLTGMLRTSSVQVVDSALVPKLPVKPNRRMIMLLAVVLGLVGGIGLALLFEYLDNTVNTHDDVERIVGLPFLGIVPSIRERPGDPQTAAEKGRTRDFHSHLRPKSSVAECIRSVRTNLLFVTPDKPLKRLLVTSSGPQEGKTTVAINLAIAFAQAGSRVLLIDTDMRRPRIHRAFGLPNDVGITTLMLQDGRIEDVVRETIVPNLYMLACGPIPPNPAELLHSERFKQVTADLEARFDRLLFDSPPVAAVTDALILSDAVDGVVLVAKAGRTVKEVMARTRASLVDVNANIFGVVLNDLDLERRGYGYYYYYQRYGYYYGEKPADA